MVIIFSLIALAFTLAGSLLVIRYGGLNRRFLAWSLAFSSGVLVSVAFMDILPAGVALDADRAYYGCLAALLAIFLVESHTVVHSCNEAIEDCAVHSLGTVAFIALSLHALTDGVSLAVGAKTGGALGTNIALGVVLHKFSGGVALASLLLKSGRDARTTSRMSLTFALMTPLGAFVTAPFLAGLSQPSMALLLGLSAGSFIYIAMADILPELHRHQEPLARLIYPFGYAVAYLIKKLGAH
ncbi:MAG: ZIP family metal transporter [Elusimicrobia bacterium]|nr:ZIP family metal transporter [Elusimicrobiota bacterium]